MELVFLEKWVLREFKIDLTAYKSNQLHRRILSFMSRVGTDNVQEFVDMLDKNKELKQKFLDFITINVTEFFRNPEIFDDLYRTMEKELLKSSNSLKIWSAACSVGAEPYSIAMMLDSSPYKCNYDILATDIDNTILEKARKGEYVLSEVKNIQKEYMNKYFTIENEKYYVSPKIKNKVTFKKHDLVLEDYEKNFDIIVCRNVVIYFNQDVKNNIYKKFYNSLKKGGLLFVGATESIYNYREYGYEKASTFIYKKI